MAVLATDADGHGRFETIAAGKILFENSKIRLDPVASLCTPAGPPILFRPRREPWIAGAALNRKSSADRHRRPPIDVLEPRTYFSPLTFGPVAEYPTGVHPDALVAGDFSNNGITDIATANYSDGTVSVLMGNGNGTFQPPVAYPVGTNPQSMTVADFNHDGIPDIVTANTGSDTISLLVGNGNGTFQPAINYAVGVRPESVATGDFNGDGSTDIVVANQGESDIDILTNNGDGTFGLPIAINVGIGPDGVAVGDLNGDGHPDIVVAVPLLNEVHVLLNDGTGGFPTYTNYVTDSQPRSVLVADLNSDGKPDIITANLHGADVSLLTNNGDGTFEGPVGTGTGNFPFSVATGDLNGDGRTDIVTANNFDNDVSVLLRNGMGAFALQHGVPAYQTPVDTIAVDVNGDGRDDLVSADFNTNQIAVTLNQTVFVPLIPTTTTLTAGQNPVQAGNVLHLTASTGTTLTAVKETGVVQFFAGDRVLGVVPINSAGVAQLSTRGLQSGDSILTAHYAGNGTYGDSTSAALTETAVAVSVAVPYVVPTIASIGLPSPFVPGDRETAVVSIFDQGAGTARGTVGINLALVPTDPSLPSYTVVTGGTARVLLAGGQTENARVAFTVPADIAAGAYSVAAALAPVGGLTADQVDSATVTSAATATAALAFGAVPGHASYKLTRTLSNGSTVTATLRGGTGTLVDLGNGRVSLALAGTSAGSVLAVTTTGPVDVDGITDPSAMGTVSIGAGEMSGLINFPLSVRKFTAESVNGADFSFGGGPPSSLIFGSMTGVNLFSAQGIHLLSVASWTDSSTDQINAPWITTLDCAGDFGAGMALSNRNGRYSLQQADIGGAVTGGVWSVADDANKILVEGVDAGWAGDVRGSLNSFVDGQSFAGSLAAGYVGSFDVAGALNNAFVLSGTNFGSDGHPGGGDDSFAAGSIGSVSVGSMTASVIAAGLRPASDDPLAVGGTLITRSVIRKITVTGTADSLSKIVSATLPRVVKIGGTTTAVAGEPLFHL